MSKYNLVFFLDENTITTNEIGTSGGLQTVAVKGFKKYEYKTPSDFEQFFQVLKDDSYSIDSFSEGDFRATVLNMGVPDETIAEFEKCLGGCKSINMLNSETSRALAEGMRDDSEIEELQNKLAEKENEIKSLNEKLEAEAGKITVLETEKKSLQEKCEELERKTDKEKELFMSALFPVDETGKSISTSITIEITKRKVKDGDEIKKGDVFALAKFKGKSFELASPADGFLFFCCKDDAVSLGQKIAVVHEKRYELVKEIFAKKGGTMPELPIYNKEIETKYCYYETKMKYDSRNLTFNSNSVSDSDIETKFKMINDLAIDIAINIVEPLIKRKSQGRRDESYNQWLKRIVVPCVEPNAPVKKGQKIAEIVKEHGLDDEE